MRLSAAAAARVYSTADGENLFVTKEHVSFVEEFLNRQYEKMEFDKYVNALGIRQKAKEEKAREPENEHTDEPKTKEGSINETQVLQLLQKDKWLFDSLDSGHYELPLEKERENRNAVKFLYAQGYVRSSDARHFKFTKAFYQELEPKLEKVLTEF
jgi:hypothetical protein